MSKGLTQTTPHKTTTQGPSRYGSFDFSQGIFFAALCISAFSICAMIMTILFVVTAKIAYGQSSTSTSYSIISQTANCGGGYSTSTSYYLFSSLCETSYASSTSPNFTTSSSYVISSGFEGTEDIPHISVTFTDVTPLYGANTFSLGTLSTSSVAEDSTRIDVTTNAQSGYVATIIANNAFRSTEVTGHDINNVTDGEVTAGSEEYGFCVTGSEASSTMNCSETEDQCIPYSGSSCNSGATKTFASKSTWVANSQTTLKVRASIDSNTLAHTDYTQTITIIVTGTF